MSFRRIVDVDPHGSGEDFYLLPASPPDGTIVGINKVSGSQPLCVHGFADELIDGCPSYSLKDRAILVFNAGNWSVI